MFPYVISRDEREIHNTLAFTEGEKDKMQPLSNKFKDFCNLKQEVTMERHTFNTRAQGKSETIDRYATDACNISKHRKFEALTEELIRDCIVCGTNSDRVEE